jgi:hypothetical protein
LSQWSADGLANTAACDIRPPTSHAVIAPSGSTRMVADCIKRLAFLAAQSCLHSGEPSGGPEESASRAIAPRRRYHADMPRALAILKYVPAVVCGLLVVAWVVSVIQPVGILTVEPSKASPSRGRGGWYLIHGSLVRYIDKSEYSPARSQIHFLDMPVPWDGLNLAAFSMNLATVISICTNLCCGSPFQCY